MDDAEVNFREVGAYGRRMDGQSELTRWADSTWAPLVRGQRVRITHGDFSGDFRVVDITPGSDGAETYNLEPAAEVDARLAAGREARTLPEYCNFCKNSLCLGEKFLCFGTRPVLGYNPSEDTRTEAPEQPEYCNVCENFPCLGGHPPEG